METRTAGGKKRKKKAMNIIISVLCFCCERFTITLHYYATLLLAIFVQGMLPVTCLIKYSNFFFSVSEKNWPTGSEKHKIKLQWRQYNSPLSIIFSILEFVSSKAIILWVHYSLIFPPKPCFHLVLAWIVLECLQFFSLLPFNQAVIPL